MVMASLVGVIAGCYDRSSRDAPPSTVEPYSDILLEGTVGDGADDDVAVRDILFAPGWQAPTHYHSSDLFIYVIEGRFEVSLRDGGAEVYQAGQALRMAARKQGVLGVERLESALMPLSDRLALPGMLDAWETRRPSFAPSFQEYLDSLFLQLTPD